MTAPGFDELFRDTSREGRLRERRRRFEASRVRWLLGQLGLLRHRRQLEELDPQGDSQLTFSAFNSTFEFPLWLCAADQLSNKRPATLVEILTQFDRQAFAKAYRARYSEMRIEMGSDEFARKPLGLVFPHTGFPQSLLLYWSGCHLLDGEGVQVTCCDPNNEPYHLLPFQQAVEAVKRQGIALEPRDL